MVTSKEKERTTCELILPFLHFHGFSQVASNFTFTSETCFLRLMLKCLSSKATKKPCVKIGEDKIEELLFHGIRRDVQLGHVVSLYVLSSQQLPRLTSLYFFSFLN